MFVQGGMGTEKGWLGMMLLAGGIYLQQVVAGLHGYSLHLQRREKERACLFSCRLGREGKGGRYITLASKIKASRRLECGSTLPSYGAFGAVARLQPLLDCHP